VNNLYFRTSPEAHGAAFPTFVSGFCRSLSVTRKFFSLLHGVLIVRRDSSRSVASLFLLTGVPRRPESTTFLHSPFVKGLRVAMRSLYHRVVFSHSEAYSRL